MESSLLVVTGSTAFDPYRMSCGESSCESAWTPGYASRFHWPAFHDWPANKSRDSEKKYVCAGVVEL